MFCDSVRYSVNNVIMEGGERFALLIDKATGLPDTYTTRYSAVFLRSKGGSVNSMAKAMRAVALALEWAETRGIDLTQRIDSGDLLTQEETTDLVNWLRLSRRKPTNSEEVAVRGAKPKRRAANARDGVPILSMPRPITHGCSMFAPISRGAWNWPFTAFPSLRGAIAMPPRSSPTGRQ